MREDLTKLARWIIPGWLTLLFFIVFILVDILFTPGCTLTNKCDLLKQLINILTGISSPEAQLLTGLSIAAVGIPLGFCVYQAYFFLRWNSPFSRNGLGGAISGRMNDLKRITDGLTSAKLGMNKTWRTNRLRSELFHRDHGDQWRYIELLFTHAAQKIDGNKSTISFYARHRYLHEVTHILGANMSALYIAFSAYFISKVLVEHIPPFTFLLPSAVLLTLFFESLTFENRERLKLELNRKNLRANKEHYPIWGNILKINKQKFWLLYPSFLLVLFTLIVHLAFNPKLNPSPLDITETIPKVLTFVFFIFIWLRSKGDKWKELAVLDLVFFSTVVFLIVVVASYSNPAFISRFPWGFASAFTAFLIGNLVLFKNRQNASDDMISMENYVLRLFLIEGRGR